MSAANNSIKIIKCPTCGNKTEWTDKNPWRPFCRERCRLIDLGAWADESHRIASTTPADFTDDESST
jgi:endogenous inhibitor of DNA gyrase (YacG/DUF329 family)